MYTINLRNKLLYISIVAIFIFYFYPRHNMLSRVSFAKCKIYNIQAYIVIGTLPDSSAKRVG